MRFTLISLCIACLAAVVRAQFGGFGFSSFGGFGLDSPLTAGRDPRQNPGPVVFPPAPPDNGETSGVVVGASGYGFVPPNGPMAAFPLWIVWSTPHLQLMRVWNSIP